MACVSVAELPKVELHLHLEGSLRKKTMMELCRRHDPSFNISESVFNDVTARYQGLPHFLNVIGNFFTNAVVEVEDYERIAYELFEDLANQNVRYVEVSFDPSRGKKLGIPFDTMLEAVNKAKERVTKGRGINIGLIIGIARQHGSENMVEFVSKAVEARDEGIVGIDLHGDEEAFAINKFKEAYEIAGRAGLGLRAHAGEGAGASSVWGVLRSLGVTRIAHGTRAVEDEALLDYLRNSDVTLDLCPTSNFKLGLVPSLAEHPIRRMFDLGIRVSVNSDDPLFFNTTITDEYKVLRDHLGFTGDELKQVTLHALEGAFLSEADREKIRAEIERDYEAVYSEK